MRKINPEVQTKDQKIVVQEPTCTIRPCVISGDDIDECEYYAEMGGDKYCNDTCRE